MNEEHYSSDVSQEPEQALPTSPPTDYTIRAAVEEDLSAVMQLLRPFVERRQVMRRTRTETSVLLKTGFVVEYKGRIVGFSAIEIYSKKLSEIQCLAVAEEHQSRGLGRNLVQKCVQLAKERGVMEVMAISTSEKLLQELGFDYSLPNQKRALFYQLRSREDVYKELEGSDDL